MGRRVSQGKDRKVDGYGGLCGALLGKNVVAVVLRRAARSQLRLTPSVCKPVDICHTHAQAAVSEDRLRRPLHSNGLTPADPSIWHEQASTPQRYGATSGRAPEADGGFIRGRDDLIEALKAAV